MRIQDMTDDEYARWRSKQIRLLYRWSKFNLALSLLSVACALWAVYLL